MKAKERSRSAARMSVEPRIEPRRVIETMPIGVDSDARTRSYWRHGLGQLNRRSPIEKATSPLKFILSFTDLAKTTHQLEVLSAALTQAKAIASDGGLDESQKRVNLRKTLKVAASAIWASQSTHQGK